jgi:hypothetical protein
VPRGGVLAAPGPHVRLAEGERGPLGEDPSRGDELGSFEEVREDVELAPSERYRSIPHHHGAPVEVDDDVRPAHDPGGHAFSRAEARADARHELLEVERFGDVVRRAELEALQAIPELEAPREDDDGSSATTLDFLEHIETAAIRQVDVENYRVGRIREGETHSFVGAGRQVDGEPLCAHPLHERGSDRRFVFDDENPQRAVAHAGILPSAGRRMPVPPPVGVDRYGRVQLRAGGGTPRGRSSPRPST